MNMESKTCRVCKQEKESTNEFFNFKDKLKGLFRSDCKKCQNIKQSEAYKKKYQLYRHNHKIYKQDLRKQNQYNLWKWLENNPCVRCGETNPVLLDLDHLRDKKYDVSQIIYCHTWDSVMKEIQKCQVLCVCCHRKKIAIERGWYSYIPDVQKYLK